jgi:asparagine synthase (glutamine-hydrolysing)
MCGITGIILKKKGSISLSDKIVQMNNALSHRGPDGEGFMLSDENNSTPHFNTLTTNFKQKDLPYAPQSALPQNTNAFIAFGHRRLAIIDLNETGHQPMCTSNAKTWIVYNGEIYNYVELREQLEKSGHRFISQSDTEVILAAYAEWGAHCVERFNGMWSFCIYDSEKKMCFASRDRLGVKPFYYVNTNDFFAFASEQKAFIRSGLLRPEADSQAMFNYFVNGLLENETTNFFKGITELWPGHNLYYDQQKHEIKTEAYYQLSSGLQNDSLSEPQLIEKIKHAFEHAVRIRLRSDVEVGTCLSGGIDSSAIAVNISEITGQPLYCFTSVFKDQPFNEEYFADLVAKKINAKYFKTEPTLQGLEKDVDALIYSQDVPIWSTSTYAQYKVMELAKEHNIKVVLDGQGADELFGGYHHHFAAKWNNLLIHGRYLDLFKDIALTGKTIPGPFIFYLKERIKQNYLVNQGFLRTIFSPGFIQRGEIKNPLRYFETVNDQLLHDIYHTRLKAFLKCEDRCGMWHGVESRTPFSDDVELMNLLFSFNGNKKLKDGVSKHLLREAVKDKLPVEIYKRYDKKGFQTPMEQWVKTLKPKMMEEIRSANFDFVDYRKLEQINLNVSFQTELFFKLFVFSKWQKVFNA